MKRNTGRLYKLNKDGGRHMQASQITQDSNNPLRKGMPRRPLFMKEITLIGEASETPQNPDKESRELSSEEDHMNFTDFDAVLEQSCMKREDVLKTPEIVGKLQKFSNRETGSEDQTVDKAALLGEWKEDVLAREEKSLSWKEPAAYQHEKRPCAQSPTPEEGQQGGTLAFPMKNVGQILEKESILSKRGSLWSSEDDTQGKRGKAKSGCAAAQTVLSRTRKTNVMTKACCVVLEDISCKIEAKGRSHSMPPKARALSTKNQKRNADKLKKLQAILKDVVEKSSLQKQRKTIQVESVVTLLANENVKEKKNFPKLNNSAELTIFSGVMGSGKVNSHYEKQEKGTSDSDIDKLCDQGVFARLSLVDFKGGDAAQPEPIKFLSTSHGKTPEMEKTKSAGSSDAFCSRTKFSKRPVGELSVSALPSEDDCGDPRQDRSDFEPGSISPFSGGDDRARAVEGGIPFRALPTGTVSPHPSPWDKKEIEEEEAVGDQAGSACSLGDRDEGDCWFLLKVEEVVEVAAAAKVVEEEEDRLRELERGGLSFGCSPGLPQPEKESTCQPLLDDVGALQPSEDGKRRTSRRHKETGKGEVSRGEDNVIPQPSKEKSPAGKFSGSAVKLLGTPSSDNQGALSLGRIPELEDSARDKGKKNKATYVSRSSESAEKGKPRSGKKPSSLDGTKTKKETRKPPTSVTPIPSALISQEQTRQMVVDALRETLQKRLDASPEVKVETNTVSRVAKKVERELFRLFCCAGPHYKNKYRSLLFNLKSAENQQLFRKVMQGEITPRRLVQMTSLEMAPQELVEWRARENRRVLEIIKKEEREAPQHCTAKFTHKGIVEIHREEEEDGMPQEILELQLHLEEDSSSEIPTAPARDPGRKIGGRERQFKLSACKATLNQKEKLPKHSHSSIMCSEDKGRPLEEDSPDSSGIPKKTRRVERQSRSRAIWKGLLQMFSVKQFMAKAYLVSGSSPRLAQVLPDLLWSRGCIIPDNVWAYLDSIWPSSSKDTAMIRFQPSISRDLRYYRMLYTYLNDKQRYGIVDSHQVEIFVVPVAAHQPVPSQLRPLSGQGLSPSHPSLLLGLILPKRTSVRSLETAAASPAPEAQTEAARLRNPTKTGPCPPAPQADPNHRQPPGSLCGDEAQGENPTPRGELFTLDTLFSLTEQLGRQMLQVEPSWGPGEGPSNGAGQSSASDPCRQLVLKCTFQDQHLTPQAMTIVSRARTRDSDSLAACRSHLHLPPAANGSHVSAWEGEACSARRRRHTLAGLPPFKDSKCQNRYRQYSTAVTAEKGKGGGRREMEQCGKTRHVLLKEELSRKKEKGGRDPFQKGCR
ncbi:hypothetical protein JRQ81_011961 [Phrynocephalus forsythii]|uniref:TFIIS central domain-containing protein n=1 Tax=Phrynocephalus forsythii TaxID=171643 RepID=A0A9Q0X7C4_9SAUR|nr:hypothetical protein JRQ81_011961 [Phrynocephalus forsythii]